MKKLVVVNLIIFILCTWTISSLAGDLDIYGKDWQIKYRIRDDKVYDLSWSIWGYVKGTQIYNREWHLTYLMQGVYIFDIFGKMEGYVKKVQGVDENRPDNPANKTPGDIGPGGLKEQYGY